MDEDFMAKEHAHYAIQMARAGGKREMIKVVQRLDLSNDHMATLVRKELKKSHQPKWAKNTEIPIHPAIRPLTGEK